MSIFAAQSLEALKGAYASATDDRAALTADADPGCTLMAIVDSHLGFNRKTQVSVGCEGRDGYLGALLIHPHLEPKQYACMPLGHLDWQVVRYQLNWFEWRGDEAIHQYTRARFAGEGFYWNKLRVRWEPGLPHDDDFDMVCDPWIEEDRTAF